MALSQISSWTGGSGEDYAYALCYDGTYLYVGLRTSPAQVKKMNRSGMSVIATWTGATNQNLCYGLAWNGANLFAALNTDSSVEANLIKINVSDMSTVSTWSTPAGTRTRSVLWASPYLYVGDNPLPGHVFQINPSTMATVATWNAPAGFSGIYALVFDGTYLYAGSQGSSPAVVCQINIATMATVATWTGVVDVENKADCLVWEIGRAHV